MLAVEWGQILKREDKKIIYHLEELATTGPTMEILNRLKWWMNSISCFLSTFFKKSAKVFIFFLNISFVNLFI
jgi:lipid A disaccharide synthetase